MGYIQRRDRPKPWLARYRGPDGRHHSKSFRRKVDAEKWLTIEEGKTIRGDWVDPTAGTILYGDWAESWLDGLHNIGPKTRTGYEGLLRSRILPTFGNVELRRISTASLRSWVADMTEDADFILAGTVVEEIGVDDDQTVFVVDVDEWVKGKTPDRIRVSQTGFKMGDTTWEVEEQPLMKVGFRYVVLLTTPPNIDSDTLTVMGGPLSAKLFSDNRMAQLRDGFEKATWPAALRDDYEATYRMASDTWAQANSGFAIPRQDPES